MPSGMAPSCSAITFAVSDGSDAALVKSNSDQLWCVTLVYTLNADATMHPTTIRAPPPTARTVPTHPAPLSPYV